ncbi:MAG: transcriptional regulator, TetR family [Phenylobacterium sp.]|nr:transcriptional regulator, TetR family [Phenylobacterium sp.]
MNVPIRRARSVTGEPQPQEETAGAPPASSVGASKPRRPDRRALKTVENIISAAQVVMFNCGTSNVSARQVCEEAQVSRGTLYRYFSSMEELLQAVALRLRVETDEELHLALEGLDDPGERFDAFIAYTASNRETTRAAHFLHVEPAFVLKYFENNFAHFIARVNTALASVFDAWEREVGSALDRDAIAEMMVRYALSETLVRTPEGMPPLPVRMRALVEMVLSEAKARTR